MKQTLNWMYRRRRQDEYIRFIEPLQGIEDFQQGSGYLIMVEAQSGAYYSCKLLMKNGKIKEESLVCKDASIPIAEFDYPEYSEPQIQFYDYTNVQPIKKTFDA